VSICLAISTMGFAMVGSCLFGMYFSNKAEDDFLPWTCNVTKTWEVRDGEFKEWIKAYPVDFSVADGMEMDDDSYLRRLVFMTKTDDYTDDNMEYVCSLYGYNSNDFSVEEEHTIIWDVEKMDKYFTTLVYCGLFTGLGGLLFYMCCWRIDNRGEVMHTKVKQIFFVLIWATAIFIAGICGLVIDLFPYNGFAKSAGGIFLALSLCFPCYCIWATCKVAKDVGLRPGSSGQGGQVHQNSGGQVHQNPGGYVHQSPGGESEMGHSYNNQYNGYGAEGHVYGAQARTYGEA